MFETRAARIDQHNAAITPTAHTFDKLTERFEYSLHRTAARHHFQEPLFASRQALCTFAIFDVGRRPIPPDNFAGFVAERFDPEQERTKDAVRTPQPYFALLRIISPAERLPFLHQNGEILGMNRGLPSPTVRLIRGETRVVMPSLINEIYATVRMTRPCQRGNSVDRTTNV